MLETMIAAIAVGILSPIYQYFIHHCVISSIMPDNNGFSICFRFDNNYLSNNDEHMIKLKEICENNNIPHHKINSEKDTSLLIFSKNREIKSDKSSICLCYDNKCIGESVHILSKHFNNVTF